MTVEACSSLGFWVGCCISFQAHVCWSLDVNFIRRANSWKSSRDGTKRLLTAALAQLFISTDNRCCASRS